LPSSRKKSSQDTGSAANGGDLGMNAKGSLASKQLEEEIFKLKPGESRPWCSPNSAFTWSPDGDSAGKARSWRMCARS
jgi:hypothetical protein